MTKLKDTLKELIRLPSITPADAGCQDFIAAYLSQLGFDCQRFDNAPVSNLFARIGTKEPLLVFAGHTDVVDVGDYHQWQSDPFNLTEAHNLLYGRGVADMKGSLACMLLMAERFVKNYPQFDGSLGFLITSGEEGDHFHLGTPYVMEELKKQGVHIHYCIVGEPTAHEKSGDVIKIGRRGSLSLELKVNGKQGHVAYPHLAENPIHRLAPALAELTSIHWDEGNEFFPATSMQITSLHSGGHGGNVIPGTLEMALNFRYSTEQNDKNIKERVEDCFRRHDVPVELKWRLNGEPFLTSHGRLLDAAKSAIEHHCDFQAELSTSGGTSDGRFIAPYGVEVIELGPSNATIHQVNESVKYEELESLAEIYYQICRNLLTQTD